MEERKDEPVSGRMAADIRQAFGMPENERLPSAEKERLWQRINRSILPERGRTQRLVWLKVAAAAIFLLALAGWLLLSKAQTSSVERMMAAARLTDTVDSPEIRLVTTTAKATPEADSEPVYHTLVVPYGKRTGITLEDSTRIWLNSGSKLVYPAVFETGRREVYLEGEAYFDVRHDEERPFFVQTKDMEIRVLGTEFNVSAYADDDNSNVVLVDGSIELTANRNSPLGKVKTRLTSHEMAVYDPAHEELEVSNTAVEEYVSWRAGYMLFENTRLSEILKKLQRYYRVRIELEDPHLENATFTGPLDLKKKIEEVMDIICLTTSLVYEKQGEKIVLREK